MTDDDRTERLERDEGARTEHHARSEVCEQIGAYNLALEARRRVLGDEHPALGSTHWELGFLFASLGNREGAIAHLRKGVDMGWGEHSILTDPSVDVLRGDPEFEAIVATVKERLGRE